MIVYPNIFCAKRTRPQWHNGTKGGKSKIEKLIEKIISIIYPPKCGICGKLDENFLCKKCVIMLKNELKSQINENNNYNKSNNVNLDEQTGFFIDEKINEQYFIQHIYFFKYEGIIRKIILDYKFNEKSYLYKTIVNFLLKDKKIFEILKFYDIIIPVPISNKRKKERGYNQSLLIAREISKLTDIPYTNDCLFKIKNIIEQSKLNKEDRIQNVQGVYKLKNEDVLQGKNILLIDDIYTTGSTVRECCKTLKQANIKEIGVLTIAKD